MASSTLIKSLEDLSQTSGESVGFQFRMKCGSCPKVVFTSEFVPFSQGSGTAGLTKFFKKEPAAPPPTQNPAWKAEHDQVAEAFANAIEDRFTWCPKCEKFVCEKCWNAVRDMCLSCCARYAQSAYDDPYMMRPKEAQKCTKCGADVSGAKFCPKCGSKVIPKGICPGCSHKVPEDALFCPECGQKLK
ncbi:MAG: zinc ribbon domain-containing protein [Candidatus Ozemobacter sibiricus]|jgi:hypothetical protein|uniref:Zinc ribbon domain-containing protein n=1 Tax=Candidatus Ozemobacter sibiricus TaxID=2268124 RepID=A0A367ZIS5_9BACT|nr:MAG: zinc ribbon domain-containing protein [Candidatus Ozemobacter sibiricus]